MAVRSPATDIPVLAGNAPGVTVAVIVVALPGATPEGETDAVTEMGVGFTTVTMVVAVAERFCASRAVATIVFAPAVVAAWTRPANVNRFPPMSIRGSAVPPPIALRSAVTVTPVLGFAP